MLDDALSTIRQAGPDFHGIIGASNLSRKIGHAFNAINNHGVAQFWDAQWGLYLPQFFARRQWTEFSILRTDTVPVSVDQLP